MKRFKLRSRYLKLALIPYIKIQSATGVQEARNFRRPVASWEGLLSTSGLPLITWTLLETTFNTPRLKGLLPHKLWVQNVKAFHVLSSLMEPTFWVYSTNEVVYTNAGSQICFGFDKRTLFRVCVSVYLSAHTLTDYHDIWNQLNWYEGGAMYV